MLKADHPSTLVLFGASGHLARIKIFPALYFLALKKRLPEKYSIVGFARTEMSDDQFRSHVEAAIREFVLEVNESVLKELLTHCAYQSGDYSDVGAFKKLTKKLDQQEGSTGGIVRLAYLSIPPSVFETTIKHICEGGVHDTKKGFRCIVEKPVGSDLASFESIYAVLAKCFPPESIYILDHYLGKEAVRNTYYLRHANPVIERLMKNTLISHVEISAMESSGLEGRAGYFDAVGTLRDMVQSHLLMIASLLAMRLVSDPKDFKATRLDAVQKFFLPHSADLSDVVVQGQYAAGKIDGVKVPGYKEEEGVGKKSRTQTYAALRLSTRSSRWEGVPFFLRTGKRLKTKDTRIVIEFHDSPTLLGKNESKNRLEIILQGEAGMKFSLMTKLGGSEPKFRPLILEDPLVCVGDCLVEHGLLLLEAINGNQTWFLDPDEVRASWRLIDPIQKHLDDPMTPLHSYDAGTPGPEEADRFIKQFGFSWHA